MIAAVAASLLVVAVVAVVVWDVRLQYRRQTRLISLAGDRAGRQAEDEAWQTYRLADYRLAQMITLQRAEVRNVETLVAALTRAERPHLGVVA